MAGFTYGGTPLDDMESFYSNAGDWRNLSKTRAAATQASVARSNAAGAAAAQGAMSAAQAQAEANKKELYGLARGRASDLANDPIDKMVLDALKQRSGPDAGPYDETTRNAMFTKQAEMAAAAQQNQVGQIHGNVTDPSYQARMSELQGQRQQSLQAAQLGIDQNANVQNYAARGQALNQLGGFNQVHNGAVTDAQHYLGGLLQSEVFNDQNAGNQAQAGLPSYSQWTTLGGGGQTIPFGSSAPYGSASGSMSYGGGASAPAGNGAAPVQRVAPYSNATVPSNRPQGPAQAYGPGTSFGGPAVTSYDANGRNTVTGVQRGTGFAQLSGQPATRVNNSTFNPNRPVY